MRGAVTVHGVVVLIHAAAVLFAVALFARGLV